MTDASGNKPSTSEKPADFLCIDDMRKLPKPVRLTFGQAILDAQRGKKHPKAKPLKGFGGAGVLEVVEDHRGGTYRAVYTVKFAGKVYVLHVFQKKSKSGMKTPTADLNKIRLRLKEAEKLHADYHTQQKANEEIRD
jgi:phage-related protein